MKCVECGNPLVVSRENRRYEAGGLATSVPVKDYTPEDLTHIKERRTTTPARLNLTADRESWHVKAA